MEADTAAVFAVHLHTILRGELPEEHSVESVLQNHLFESFSEVDERPQLIGDFGIVLNDPFGQSSLRALAMDRLLSHSIGSTPIVIIIVST